MPSSTTTGHHHLSPAARARRLGRAERELIATLRAHHPALPHPQAGFLRRRRDATGPPSGPAFGAVATGSASRASRVRMAAQIVLGALAWIGFEHLVAWQLVNDAPPDWWFVVSAIVVVLLLLVLAALGWVAWNERLARRGRRQRPVRQDVAFERDALGRRIESEPGVRGADEAIVTVEDQGRIKHYRRK